MTTTSPEISLDFDPGNFLKSFWDIAKFVFLNPRTFFEKMKRTGGLGSPAIYLGICVVVQTFFVGLGVRSAEIVLKNIAMGIVFPFLTAGVLFYFITKLFHASGTYEMAFRVNAYAATISLLSWVPGIGLLLEAYRLYLLTVGLSVVFSLKTSKAFLAIVLTLIVFLIASGALVHLFGGNLFQSGA
jgi:hypothetical protein